MEGLQELHVCRLYLDELFFEGSGIGVFGFVLLNREEGDAEALCLGRQIRQELIDVLYKAILISAYIDTTTHSTRSCYLCGGESFEVL